MVRFLLLLQATITKKYSNKKQPHCRNISETKRQNSFKQKPQSFEQSKKRKYKSPFKFATITKYSSGIFERIIIKTKTFSPLEEVRIT